MSKKKGTSFNSSLDNIINYAIDSGLQQLISKPGLEEYKSLILKNLDDKKIYSLKKGLDEFFAEYNISKEEQPKIIYENIANYVASGNALKENIKAIILEESYEEKEKQSVLEKIADKFKPRKFEGEKYFERAREAYGIMHDLLMQNEVAQKEIPELVDAAKKLKMYGFLNPALKNFRFHKLIDEETYKTLFEKLHEQTAISSEKGIRGIEKYISSKKKKDIEENKEQLNSVPYKIATFILLAIGASLIFISRKNFTGFVIGDLSYKTSGLIGMGLTLVAIILFFIITRNSK